MRQMILREFEPGAFPYRGANTNGRVNHFVSDAKDVGSGNVGRTNCGRNTQATELRSRIDVLNLARNPCQQCLRCLSEYELETLALMASASSQHEITASDITDTDDDND